MPISRLKANDAEKERGTQTDRDIDSHPYQKAFIQRKRDRYEDTERGSGRQRQKLAQNMRKA
jgi:hypothetical protein